MENWCPNDKPAHYFTAYVKITRCKLHYRKTEIRATGLLEYGSHNFEQKINALSTFSYWL